MWGNTRMVVLSAISASLYAAVLVPFKVVPLIPGVTELRPANAIPVVCSFMFGPAAAWGAAIGNLIGDFFGGVGPADIFGFFANVMYGYVPYKVWQVMAKNQAPGIRSPRTALTYVVACLVASTFCADIVGWGENLHRAASVRHAGQCDRVQQHARGLADLTFSARGDLSAREGRPSAL